MSKEAIYDEDDAVKFIRNYLPQDLKTKFSDDDILYVTDLVCDYYETSGALGGNEDDVVDIDEDAMIQFVETNARKDGVIEFDDGELAHIVRGELDYCESIHLFE